MEICKSTQCNMLNCVFRHPTVCRYFSNFGRCKFSESCAYLHETCGTVQDTKISLVKIELENELKSLKDEIKILEMQVAELTRVVNQVSNNTNLKYTAQSQPPTFTSSSRSSIIMAETNILQANSKECIPQLDGNTSTNHNKPQVLQCETCNEVFENKDAFNFHDTAHQFCCDECHICYRTQIEADLHELAVHPNDPYASTYIPESTKLLFARRLQSRN